MFSGCSREEHGNQSSLHSLKQANVGDGYMQDDVHSKDMLKNICSILLSCDTSRDRIIFRKSEYEKFINGKKAIYMPER